METINTAIRANEESLSTEFPNAETRDAINEVQKMKENPFAGKAYIDIDQMMQELLQYNLQ